MINANDWCETCGKRVGNHLLVEYMQCTGKAWVRLMPMNNNESGQITPWNVFWGLIFLFLMLAILAHFGII